MITKTMGLGRGALTGCTQCVHGSRWWTGLSFASDSQIIVDHLRKGTQRVC